MSDLPQDVTVHVNEEGRPQRLTVGEYDFAARHVLDGIAVSLTPGARTPPYKLWLCLEVEGTITDPSGSLRMVHEGDIDPFSNARPGPCGHVLPAPEGWQSSSCGLDAGHAGCHKDDQSGTVWREIA